MRTVSGLVALVLMLTGGVAWAGFHEMNIVQVFPGTTAAPNAQYVQLQMRVANQNLVSGHSIIVYDAAGAVITGGTFTFTGNVTNAANQATILIATTEAATLFNVTADLAMTAVIPLAGGKVCFDTIDCVSWGSYTGSNVGTGTPTYQQLGLRRGQAIVRRLEISGGTTTLEFTDDTGNSANDFRYGEPAPRTNGGTNGTLPSSTCGNNAITGLEQCDDNNTTSNDGCSATCQTEACGDGIVQTAEQCDDTNLNANDSCTNTCTSQIASIDSPPDAGALNADAAGGGDAGNNNNNGDDGGCCQSGNAGAAPWLAGLVLAMLLRRRRRATR